MKRGTEFTNVKYWDRWGLWDSRLPFYSVHLENCVTKWGFEPVPPTEKGIYLVKVGKRIFMISYDFFKINIKTLSFSTHSNTWTPDPALSYTSVNP